MPERHRTIAKVSTRDTMAAPVASVMQRTGNRNREELSPRSSSANKRPCTLTLEPKHRRIPFNDSSDMTTPAPDPPLISPAACELPQTCQGPLAHHHFQQSRNASSPILPNPCMVPAQVGSLGTSPSQKHPICTSQSGLPLPSVMISGCNTDAQRRICSRMIADRLRTIGDQYARQYSEHQLESRLSSLIFDQNPASTGFTSTLCGCLKKVREIFQIGYYLLKALTAEFGPNVNKLPREDKQWTLFRRLLDIMKNAVSPWIWEHGGRMEFPQSTEGVEDNTTARAVPSLSLIEPSSSHQCSSEPMNPLFIHTKAPPFLNPQTLNVTPCRMF